MDILAAMQCQKLGKPTWTVFSTGGGLGVKLFWRNSNSEIKDDWRSLIERKGKNVHQTLKESCNL